MSLLLLYFIITWLMGIGFFIGSINHPLRRDDIILFIIVNLIIIALSPIWMPIRIGYILDNKNGVDLEWDDDDEELKDELSTERTLLP